MDGAFYGRLFDGLIQTLLVAGVIIGLVIAGLVYGGYCLVSHYRIKVEKRPTTSLVVTNTVTNYVYLPNTNK